MAGELKLTWRVSDAIWMDDDRFSELMAMLLRQKDTADEVAFFLAEPSNGAYHPLEIVAHEADVFAKRAVQLRAAGKTVGINVWPTFGTGQTFCMSEKRPPVTFRRMVGIDGVADASLVCPTSPEFLEYIREKYTVLAKAGPDFIWVDDDTRFTDLEGVPYPCFCDDCVKNFENGRFTCREDLVAALNQPENRELRHRWSEYGADRLARFCAEIRAAVDAVNLDIDTPFMTVGPTHTTYSGDFIEKCMTALRSRRGRPGHGFYWDANPNGMLEKCMEAGRQIVYYPKETTDIFYEEESCPCVHLEKALRTRRNEVTLALAAGCTGVAFNHLNANPRMDELLAREVDELHQARPVWERYAAFAKDLPWQGLWPAYSWFMMAGMDCTDGWFKEDNADYSITKPEALGRIGLPLTVDQNAACATLFSGKTIRTFSEKELEKIFSGNVLMDVFALQELEKMGMESLAGVRSGKYHHCTSERLNGHPFNGPFEGFSHNGLFQPAYDLLALDESVETLAYSADGYGTVYGSCLTKYENALGGKVVVSGYDCWRFISDPHKLWQFAAIADWMDAPLTLRWANPLQVSRIQPFVRSNGQKAAVLLVNASLDTSEPVTVVLRGSMTKAVALTKGGAELALPCTREEDRLCIQVPSIDNWDILTLLAE